MSSRPAARWLPRTVQPLGLLESELHTGHRSALPPAEQFAAALHCPDRWRRASRTPRLAQSSQIRSLIRRADRGRTAKRGSRSWYFSYWTSRTDCVVATFVPFAAQPVISMVELPVNCTE